MTNNIEKLYELAKVEKKSHCDYTCNCRYLCSTNCTHYNEKIEEFPPFTPEKQLNILKIIVHSFGFNSLDKPIWDKGWDIAIAKLVNIYWEVLTEEEKQEIKRILE